MIKTLPGFREFWPEDCLRRNFIFSQWRSVARRFAYREYDGPILEPLELYQEKSGEEIKEQLFAFTDKGDRSVALRPEMTPTLARMVAARYNSLPKPVKWFSIGEQFRYERYQKGRKRSFYQFNADILGEAGPAAEVELISLLVESLRSFGLGVDDFAVRLSDRTLWLVFLEGEGLTREVALQVLTVVDKLEREPPEVLISKLSEVTGQDGEKLLSEIKRFCGLKTKEALEEFFGSKSIAENLWRDRLEDWSFLQKGLLAMGLADFVEIDLGIVRGLAYYTGFVFEAFDREKAHRAIAGGGRYDELLGKLGKVSCPAVGFAVGDVVLENVLTEKGRLPNLVQAIDFYVIGLSEEDRSAVWQVVAMLRAEGWLADYSLRGPGGMKKQFKSAEEAGARFAILIGEEERAANQVKVKNLASREEFTLGARDLGRDLRRMLEGGGED